MGQLIGVRSTHRAHRHFGWHVVAALVLLSAACGGSNGALSDATGAASSPVPGGAAAQSAAATSSTATKTGSTGGRLLSGSVCTLLTTDEIEAVMKTGGPLKADEIDDPDSERACEYHPEAFDQFIVRLELQGEKQPSSWSDIKSSGDATAVPLNGAEGIFSNTIMQLYVHKNALTVSILAIPVTGGSPQELETAFAQRVAGRLP